MSNLQIIERLCTLLEDASRIIKEQAGLLELHGICTETGDFEKNRKEFLDAITEYGIRIE